MIIMYSFLILNLFTNVQPLKFPSPSLAAFSPSAAADNRKQNNFVQSTSRNILISCIR